MQSTICSSEFTWPCSWALATVQCESGGDPHAHGHEWFEGTYYHFLGIWQVAVTTHDGYEWLYDPYLNTVEAHIKYHSQGVGAWPVCGR